MEYPIISIGRTTHPSGYLPHPEYSNVGTASLIVMCIILTLCVIVCVALLMANFYWRNNKQVTTFLSVHIVILHILLCQWISLTPVQVRTGLTFRHILMHILTYYIKHCLFFACLFVLFLLVCFPPLQTHQGL